MNSFIPGFDRLQRALAELSPARRLFAGALVAVTIATGVWGFSRAWSGDRNAGSSEMEPVLDQPFAQAEVDRIVKHLNAKSITNKVEDGKVLVPSEQRLDALSDLIYVGILGGSGNASGFEALVKQMTAWDAPSKTDKMFNHYREQQVEDVVGRYPGVRKTTVIIDPTNQRHLGGESVLPTAMVDIQTRGDGSADRRQLSRAAVNVLTGVVANLSADRVRVTIDGATSNTGADSLTAGSGSSGDLLERKQKCEQLHVAKVRQILSYIPGDVLVSVSVDLDVPAVVDEGEANAKLQAEGEGAVVANAVPVIGDATKSAAQVRSDVVRSASVAVPRSYFVKVYRRATTGTQEPTDALLQPVLEAYSLKIRNLVKNALALDDDAVSIEPYEDALPASATEAAAVASATVSPNGAATAGSAAVPIAAVTKNLNAYAREIALVTLGAVVLTALSLIVRRRSPMAGGAASAAVMVDPSGRQHQEVVQGTIEDIDDPENTHFSGHDDGAEAHQLFRRVRDMSQEHPEGAARVLREWIYQRD